MALSHASAAREGGGEALIGVVRAGLLSREIELVRGADAFITSGRRCSWRRYRESLGDPARSENPGTYEGLHAREPGDPVVDHGPLVMPRPGWFAGWQIGGLVVRGGNA